MEYDVFWGKSTRIFLLFTVCFTFLIASKSGEPVPTPWPLQFHLILFLNNNKGNLEVVDLWYDWPNHRNFKIIQNQLGECLYDLEWGKDTSFYYTLDANKKCKVMHFPVGILRPNWLQGGKYVGQRYMDGFLCNVWEKIDFIHYYEDVVSKRHVYWAFYIGMIAHVMAFEVGKVLEYPNWQAPAYCFNKPRLEEEVSHVIDHDNISVSRLKGEPMDVSY